MSDGVQCDKCGFLFKGHSNHYGKICTRCSNYIEPIKNAEKIYDDKNIEAQESVRAYLKQYLQENNSANQRE